MPEFSELAEVADDGLADFRGRRREVRFLEATGEKFACAQSQFLGWGGQVKGEEQYACEQGFHGASLMASFSCVVPPETVKSSVQSFGYISA